MDRCIRRRLTVSPFVGASIHGPRVYSGGKHRWTTHHLREVEEVDREVAERERANCDEEVLIVLVEGQVLKSGFSVSTALCARTCEYGWKQEEQRQWRQRCEMQELTRDGFLPGFFWRHRGCKVGGSSSSEGYSTWRCTCQKHGSVWHVRQKMFLCRLDMCLLTLFVLHFELIYRCNMTISAL